MKDFLSPIAFVFALIFLATGNFLTAQCFDAQSFNQPGLYNYTIPGDGSDEYTIEIDATGADGAPYLLGGNALYQGGTGAFMKASFTVFGGDELTIFVGEQGGTGGSPSGGGGGGGTAVVLNENNVLIAAGAGGGGGNASGFGGGGQANTNSFPAGGAGPGASGGGGFNDPGDDGQVGTGGGAGTLTAIGVGGIGGVVAGWGGDGFGGGGGGAGTGGGGGGGFQGGNGATENNLGGLGGDSFVNTQFDSVVLQTTPGQNGAGNLNPGSVVLTCTASTGGGELEIDVTEQSDPLCNGGNDGFIIVSASNGFPAYEYSIDGENFGADASFDNLEAGSYTITVMDSEETQVSVEVVLIDPPLLIANASAVGESAPDADDGSVTSSPSGGTPPYSFLWSTDDMSAEVNDLSPGIYTVAVTDFNGCSVTDTVEVLEYIEFQVEIANDITLCAGDTAMLTATSTGGIDPILYTWNTGDEGPEIEVFEGGTYIVTAVDSMGSMAIDTSVVTLTEPIVIDNIVISHEMAGSGNGSIELDVAGGTPPFEYSWLLDDVFFNLEEDIFNLSEGSYCLTVTDVLGCSAKTDILVIDNILSIPALEQEWKVFPNPAATSLVVVSDKHWDLRILDIQGNVVLTFSNGLNETLDISSLSPGLYITRLASGNYFNNGQLIISR